MRDGPLLSKAIVSFAGVIRDLSHKRNPRRVINFNNSVLTRILQEELSANFRTRVLVCMKPQSDADVLGGVLKVAEQLSQVSTFPVLNDLYSQFLLTQLRARLQKLELDLGADAMPGQPSLFDVKEELLRVQTENLELRDKSERLLYRLEQLQSKYGTLAHSKVDLNSELLNTEEEKLKVSKALVELEIENNKLKEDNETMRYELNNRVLELENQLMEAQMRGEKWHSDSIKLHQTEAERKELADEYIQMREKYLAMNADYGSLVAKNEELSMELLNLVNSKNELIRQRDTMGMAGVKNYDVRAEMDRVKAMIQRTPADARTAADSGRRNKEKERKFLRTGDVDRELEGLRGQYDKDQDKLRDRINFLLKELQETRNLARNRLQTISGVKAELVSTRTDRDHLQQQCNRFQHKLRDLHEEYRARLVRYVQDIADFEQNQGGANMRDYVGSMLADLRRAHKAREEQLSTAAQDFRARMMNTAREHEALLIAYENLRLRVEEKYPDVNPGPDITDLGLTDPELVSTSQHEIIRMNQELNRAKHEIRNLKLRVRSPSDPPPGPNAGLGGGGDSMRDLRRQLKDFTSNVQAELETERADLIARNQVLEEQLKEARNRLERRLGPKV